MVLEIDIGIRVIDIRVRVSGVRRYVDMAVNSRNVRVVDGFRSSTVGTVAVVNVHIMVFIIDNIGNIMV